MSLWIIGKPDSLSWPIVVRVQNLMLNITEKLLQPEVDKIGKTKVTWNNLNTYMDKQFYW